jgi:hypothetical protein
MLSRTGRKVFMSSSVASVREHLLPRCHGMVPDLHRRAVLQVAPPFVGIVFEGEAFLLAFGFRVGGHGPRKRCRLDLLGVLDALLDAASLGVHGLEGAHAVIGEDGSSGAHRSQIVCGLLRFGARRTAEICLLSCSAHVLHMRPEDTVLFLHLSSARQGDGFPAHGCQYILVNLHKKAWQRLEMSTSKKD